MEAPSKHLEPPWPKLTGKKAAVDQALAQKRPLNRPANSANISNTLFNTFERFSQSKVLNPKTPPVPTCQLSSGTLSAAPVFFLLLTPFQVAETASGELHVERPTKY